jgi:hypothetical protein
LRCSTNRAVSFYSDTPKNEKISGVIIRENEYGTQELRRKKLKIDSPMWKRWSANLDSEFADARPIVELPWIKD